jgi:hypothetical protein
MNDGDSTSSASTATQDSNNFKHTFLLLESLEQPAVVIESKSDIPNRQTTIPTF